MFRVIIAALVVALLVSPGPTPAPAQANKDKDPLAERVRRAIDDGKRYLYDKQKPDGSWEVDLNSEGRRAGWTSLALLALLNCGDKADSPVVARGLKWLREQAPGDTYVIGLQTMVFAEAGQAQDLGRIQRNVDWLIKHRVPGDDKQMIGWGYKADARTADMSNTQYALLGLWAGKNAGAKINAQIWDEIVQFYMRTQDNTGYWYYIPQYKTSSFTMSVAGVCGLIISGQDVNTSLQKLDEKTGVAAGCGKYVENEPVAKGMSWIVKNFNVEGKGQTRLQATFYNMYGLERLGRLTGQRFFGEYDWYREGCEYLTKQGMQQENGSWYLRGSHFDSWPVVSTSFSLLFLSKGRTPVLISKLVHGPLGDAGSDWNRKHNDLRHVVDYASRELFKKQPMGWQVFNARQTQKNADDLLPELLQSPIAWMSGHNRPNLTDGEIELLVKYLEQGGFLFAEACCGSDAFDKGFRELLKHQKFKDLFGENQLKKLPPEHPIWKAHALIADPNFELWGIEHGCKTVVVYSPRPIAGYWEANQAESGRGREAFRLAGNVIAYATGMEPPKPKGVEIEVPKDKPEAKAPRGFVKVAQLRLTDGTWRPAHQAVRNLMAHLRDKAGLDASLVTQEIFPDDVDLLNFKFMYLHGRSEFTIKSLKVLKANLEQGGVLFADACCGKDPFDKSFRELVKQLFPDQKLEAIPAADDVYSKELNGQTISSVRVRREAGAAYENAAPALEGIKVNGRWVVIYSKYDIGCALEKHQSTDCRGHDHESALRLASAALLYALQR